MKMKKHLIIILLLISSAFAQNVIVALHPSGKQFETLVTSLKENLGNEIQVKSIEIQKNDTWHDLKDQISAHNPSAFLLLDNRSIVIYEQYLSDRDTTQNPIPAVATMALQLEKVTEGISLLGISYEIPVVTSIVHLRPIVKNPISKVGVIYRSSMEDFIAINKEYCNTESIELISYKIDADDSEHAINDIKKGLKQLFKENLDALWIVNDNILINGKSLIKSWIPNLKKMKIPVIVGVESLIDTKLKIGNFAVLPDNIALGSQAAELFFELMDNNWVVDERRIDQPISVIKTLNRTLAGKGGFLNEDGLSSIDKEIE